MLSTLFLYRRLPILLCGALALTPQPSAPLHGAEPTVPPAQGVEEPTSGLDLSTRKDALRAVDQGIEWLRARQNADGSWSSPPQPAHSTSSRLAVTALATRAILRDPARESGKLDASAEKGLEFIASCAQEDGGLYEPRDASRTRSTAASMLALAESRQERYKPLILAARGYLSRAQDLREGSEQFGGWADSGSPADVRTTALAIEALAATERIAIADAERNHSVSSDPDWSAGVAFLSRCQRLAGTDPKDQGGFSSGPAEGPARHPEGAATALALTALLESDIARSDRRVLSAVGWLRFNYSLDEQPGVPGRRGLYSYYHALADALNLYGEEPLLLPGARSANWRRALTIKLISLQRSDAEGLGYWVSDQGDPTEKDPALVTAHCVLTFEMLVDETAS
jgi:squalene-hopene/tetraprenyl-beta-curcumene cyclase